MNIKVFLIILLLFFQSNLLFSEGATLIVNSVQKSIPKGQLKMIFKGDREEWPEGGKVIVLLNSDDAIMEKFCKSFLGMSYNAFQEIQVRNNIRSGKAYPRKVSTEVMMTLISKSKNFIGVVPSEKIQAGNIVGID